MGSGEDQPPEEENNDPRPSQTPILKDQSTELLPVLDVNLSRQASCSNTFFFLTGEAAVYKHTPHFNH